MTGWAIPGVRIRVVDSEGPRRPARRRADRRDRRPRQHRHGRLLPRPGGDRGHHPRRLAPHRRHGHDRRGGLRPDQGPLEGHHHPRRARTSRRSRSRSPWPPIPRSSSARSSPRRTRSAARSPVALVVLKPDATATAGELRAFCRARLARFKVPREIHFRDALPKGGTGKILKAELREPFWKGMASRVH